MLWLSLAGFVLAALAVWAMVRGQQGGADGGAAPGAKAKPSPKGQERGAAPRAAKRPAPAAEAKAPAAADKVTRAESRPVVTPSPRPRLPSLVRMDDDEESGAFSRKDLPAPFRELEVEEESTALVEVTPEMSGGRPDTAALRVHTENADFDEPTGMHSTILVTAVAQSDPGRKRRFNEDCFLVEHQHGVFVVADGMGGHQAGDVASKLAVGAILEAFEKGSFDRTPKPQMPKRGHELVQAVLHANQTVYSHAKDDSSFKGMGTTVVAARFAPRKQRAYIAHVGDSRCYRMRDGKLTLLTTDHTFASLTGASGSIGSRLTRALGMKRSVEVDLDIDMPLPRDQYVLCSDGLTKVLSDEEIRDVLLATRDLQVAAQKLVDTANDRGGPDNITVILVRVDPVQDISLAS